MSSTALSTAGRFPVRRKRPNRPSVDNALRASWRPPNGVRFTVNGVTEEACGRTLEEAFGLENADWCQHIDRKGVGLKLRPVAESPKDLARRLHRRVVGKHFDKTKFALEVLASGPEEEWKVPTYIADGLRWLENIVAREDAVEVAVAIASAEVEAPEVLASPLGGGIA